jgi:3-methyladenine DNA glycosylase Mpg
VRALRREPLLEIQTTPRIGIAHSADWPLRFVVKKALPCLTS